MTSKGADLLEIFEAYPEDMELLLREPFEWTGNELKKLVKEEAPGKDYERLSNALEVILEATKE